MTKIHSQMNLGGNRSQIGAVLGLYFTKPDVSLVRRSAEIDEFDSSSLVKEAVSTSTVSPTKMQMRAVRGASG